MANLIRLKQIESGSALTNAAATGTDFSQSVINIIQTEIVAVLPDGIVSSSAQIEIVSASGYMDLATDLEVAVISGSISASSALISSSISSSIATTFSGSIASITTLSSSVSNSISLLSSSISQSIINTVSSSLSSSLSIIATDIEVSIVSSSLSASQTLISSSISSSIANTLSGSVASINTLSSSVSTSLGLLSSSVDTKIIGLTASYDSRYTLSGSITQTTWDNIANKPDGVVSGSSQVIGILDSLNQFTSSLGDTFATDYEVYVTTSNIIDQGEW